MKFTRTATHLAAYTTLALYGFDVVSAPMPAIAYTLLTTTEAVNALLKFKSAKIDDGK